MLAKINRLPRIELKNLQARGKRFHSPLATLLVGKGSDVSSPPRFAVVVTKKLDKRATRRNRTRRLFHEVIRQLLPNINQGFNCVIYAKKILWEEKAEDIKPEIKHLLKKIGLLNS